MLQQLTFDDFISLSQKSPRVLVFQELMADRLTPVGIFEALSEEMKNGVMLESGLQNHANSRYSYLAFDLMAQLRANKNIITQSIGQTTSSHEGNSFTSLRKLLSELSYTHSHEMNVMTGNVVGYISYDSVRLFESIPERHIDNTQLPDIVFNIYRTTLIYDHQQQTLRINVITECSQDKEQSFEKTQKIISQIISKISQYTSRPLPIKNTSIDTTETDIEDKEFIKLIERAKKYITDGDAFQIVLSRCFKKSYIVSPFTIYRALRKVSPSPYMFYFPIDDTGADGIMVEVHPEPDQSFSDANQTISPTVFSEMMSSLRIIGKAVNMHVQ